MCPGHIAAAGLERQIMSVVLQTFFSVLIEEPLPAIIASSLLGYDKTSLALTGRGFFSHSSLQILSSSVRFDGDQVDGHFQATTEMID